MAESATIDGLFGFSILGDQELKAGKLIGFKLDLSETAHGYIELLPNASDVANIIRSHSNSSWNPLNYAYLKSGNYTVRASLYEMVGVVYEKTDSLDLEIRVKPSSDLCVKYKLTETHLNIQPNSVVSISIGLVFTDGRSVSQSDEALTREIISLGEIPKVTLLTDHAIGVIKPSAHEYMDVSIVDNLWVILLETRWWVGIGWLQIEPSTHIFNIIECGIESSIIPIFVSNIPDNGGWIASVLPSVVSVEEDSGIIVVSQHNCLSNFAVALVLLSDMSYVLLVTDDAFISFLSIHLSDLDMEGLEISNTVMLTHDTILLSTSQGLFSVKLEMPTRSELVLEGSEWNINGLGQCRDEEGVVLNGKEFNRFSSGIYVNHESQLHYVSVQTGSIVVENLTEIVDMFASDLSGVVSSPVSSHHLMLFQDTPSAVIGMVCNKNDYISDPKCYSARRNVLRPQSGFIFPEFSNITGICSHATGMAVFAYGDDLWISNDGGESFEIILSLGPEESVVSCPISISTSGVFVSVTTKNNIYGGAVSAAGMLSIVGQLRKKTFIAVDPQIGVYVVAYNNGLLERFIVPVQDLIPVSKVPLSFPLVFSATDVFRWSVFNQQGEPVFLHQQHVGMMLMPLNIPIESVNDFVAMGHSDSYDLLKSYALDGFNCSLRVIFESELSANINVETCVDVDDIPLQFALLNVPGVSINVGGSMSLVVPTASLSNNYIATRLLFLPSHKLQTNFSVSSSQWAFYHLEAFWLEIPACEDSALQIFRAPRSPIMHVIDKGDHVTFEGAWTSNTINYNKNSLSEVWEANKLMIPLKVLRTNYYLTTFRLLSYSDSIEEYDTKLAAKGLSADDTVLFKLVFYPTGGSMLHSSIMIYDRSSTLGCFFSGCDSIVRLGVACPDAKHIEIVSSNSSDWYELPPNYQPPSYRGVSIPLTPNVYNVDFSQHDPYRLLLSKKMRVYKQCESTSATSPDCGCDESDGDSGKVSMSDCIKRVQVADYQVPYVPVIQLFDRVDDLDGVPSTSRYRIQDLNGRFDFCTSADISRCSTDYNAEEEFFVVLDPKNQESIRFAGVGLYHFEIQALDDETFCDLRTSFTLYVVNAPSDSRFDAIIISCTAVVFLLSLMGSYLFTSQNRFR